LDRETAWNTDEYRCGIGFAQAESMSAQRFASGAVLERASPVLTFSTEAAATRQTAGPPRKRADTPTPLPVTRPNLQASESCALPVIPRIVRRTIVDGDGAVLRAVARAARVARGSVLGSMAGVALLLAALGASAGVALKSLSDPWQAAPSVVSVSDATASERVLVHALDAPRVEKRVGADSVDVPANGVSASSAGNVSAPAAVVGTEGTEATRIALRSSSPAPAGAAPHPRAGQPAHGSAPPVGHIAPRQRGGHPNSSRPGARRATTDKAKAPKPH
jgi:hypothetical protein